MNKDQTNKASLPQKIKGWGHIPKVPILVSPFFAWPLNPLRMIIWIWKRWFTITENLIILAITLVTWNYFHPSMERTRDLSIDWIAEIWIRNFILLILVAGVLHWFFYMRKGQGNKLKYDPRSLMHNGKQFSFGGQVRDNMFWSLTSGVGFWTAYEVLIFWAMSNGYAPRLNPIETPIIFIIFFWLTPLWISFHFYWIHRLLHYRPLYRFFHSVHHRNVNVGPWSGLSMHPGEHLLFFSSLLIHFIVPTHPLHILFHIQHQALQAVSSHSGYESLLVKDKKTLDLGTFHHQMHHRYFEVNYGTLEIPWDKWFGTFHNGTVESHQKLKNRSINITK
mgnify:CR=1 FL=1